MIEIKKTVIVPFTPKQMFEIVNDIETYPNYLPWCSSTKIQDQTEDLLVGSIYLEYLKVKTHFTTRNKNTPYSHIDVQLVDGPFKELSGTWNFKALGENGCKIEFSLNYKFTNSLFEKIIGPVFEYITKNIVECFIKEAHIRHGSNIISKS